MKALFFALLLLVTVVTPVLADATPTPVVVNGETGVFYVTQSVSYGEAGVIVGLFLVAGLLLLQVALEVSRWLRE